MAEGGIVPDGQDVVVDEGVPEGAPIGQGHGRRQERDRRPSSEGRGEKSDRGMADHPDNESKRLPARSEFEARADLHLPAGKVGLGLTAERVDELKV